MDTHLQQERDINSNTPYHVLTHKNRLTDIPADQHTPTLIFMQTPKQPEAKLSAWASICRLFSLLVSLLILGSMGSNTSFKYRSVPLIHFLTSVWNQGIATPLGQIVKCILWICVHLFNLFANFHVTSSFVLSVEFTFDPLVQRTILLSNYSVSFHQGRNTTTYRGSSGCVLREKSFQASPRWGRWWSPDSALARQWPLVSLRLHPAAV